MPNTQKDVISFPLHVSEELERLFDEMIHRPWGVCREMRGWNPSIDLYETDEAFILEADLPGVKSDNVKMEIDGNELLLSDSRSIETRSIEGHFHTMERSSGDFVRRIKLREPVDKDAIKYESRDGVLRVILPKARTRPDENG